MRQYDLAGSYGRGFQTGAAIKDRKDRKLALAGEQRRLQSVGVSARLAGEGDKRALDNPNLTPDEIKGLQDQLSNVSKEEREIAAQKAEKVSVVLSGVRNEEDYKKARNFLALNGDDISKLPEQYDPDFVAMGVNKTRSIANVIKSQEAQEERTYKVGRENIKRGQDMADFKEKETFKSKLPKKSGVTVNVGDQNYKVPNGYMLKDGNDPSQGVTPIPGGPQDKVTATDAAKVQMIRTAKEAAKGVKALMFDKDDSPNWTNITAAQMNVPKSEGRDLRVSMEYGIQAITRAETGAAMPPSEVENTRERFMPKVGDTEETVKMKAEMFNDFLDGSLKLIDPSGRFNSDRFKGELEKRTGSKIVMSHEKHGEVTEDDIKRTMKNHNLTREEVMEKLNGGS